MVQAAARRKLVFLVALGVGLSFQRRPVASFKLFPPVAKNRLSLCRKLGIGTGKHRRYRIKNVRLGGGEQQTRPGKGEDIFFAFRQRGKVCFRKLHCRNDGVVVGHLFAVKRPGYVRRKRRAFHKGQLADKQRGDMHRRISHVVGQIIAVRSRVGKKPLFVKGLCNVKGLLCGVTVNAVGFPLQARKVEQAGRLLGFPLTSHRNAHGLRRFASRFYRFRFCGVGDPCACRFRAAHTTCYSSH